MTSIPDAPRRAETVCYIDCETTSLIDPWLLGGRRVWEITVHRVRGHAPLSAPIGLQGTRTLVIEDVDLTGADPVSLDKGGYWRRGDGALARASERDVAGLVERFTRGAVLIGLNVGFDAASISEMLYRNGLPVGGWHYTPHDVKAAAVAVTGLPLTASSDDIARALGIDPDGYDRHTSLGDVAFTVALDRAIVARPAS